MRLFLLIGQISPKAKKNPGDWKTISQPTEEKQKVFDTFFNLVEKDDKTFQELRLINTNEGLERRHIFDPIL